MLSEVVLKYKIRDSVDKERVVEILNANGYSKVINGINRLISDRLHSSIEEKNTELEKFLVVLQYDIYDITADFETG